MKGKDIGLKGPWADAEIISSYSREQALSDGVLVDMTEWASVEKGFMGGFACRVAMTAALWAKVQAPKNSTQDTRGRAHDVLWMALLAVRREVRRRGWDSESQAVSAALGLGCMIQTHYKVRLGRKNEILRAVLDGDGVTIGFPEDF